MRYNHCGDTGTVDGKVDHWQEELMLDSGPGYGKKVLDTASLTSSAITIVFSSLLTANDACADRDAEMPPNLVVS